MAKFQEFFLWVASLPFGVKLLISAAFVLLSVAALILMWTPQNKATIGHLTLGPSPDAFPQEPPSPTPTPTVSPTPTPTPTPTPMKTSQNSCPPVNTGDNVIDTAQAKLCDLHAVESGPSETDVVKILKPLFSRPAFYGIREENWEYFLFTLCRTRVLLEENVGYFNSSSVRKRLGDAIQLMVKLQNEVSRIYGPTFSITRHMARYLNSRDDFTRNLPRVVEDPDYEFFDNRDKTIKEIRAILKPLGLTDW